MPEKNLNFAANVLSSYLFVAFLGVLALVASPFALVIGLFLPGDIVSLFQGNNQGQ